MLTAGGVRPQLLITTDLNSLQGGPGGLGGGPGWGEPLDQPACRRLACDGAVTRVLVTRHPIAGHGPGGGSDHDPGPDHDPDGDLGACDPSTNGPGLQERLRAALALLPPTLGGAPSQPLDIGRATRVVQPAQRMTLGRPRPRLCLPRL